MGSGDVYKRQGEVVSRSFGSPAPQLLPTQYTGEIAKEIFNPARGGYVYAVRTEELSTLKDRKDLIQKLVREAQGHKEISVVLPAELSPEAREGFVLRLLGEASRTGQAVNILQEGLAAPILIGSNASDVLSRIRLAEEAGKEVEARVVAINHTGMDNQELMGAVETAGEVNRVIVFGALGDFTLQSFEAVKAIAQRGEKGGVVLIASPEDVEFMMGLREGDFTSPEVRDSVLTQLKAMVRDGVIKVSYWDEGTKTWYIPGDFSDEALALAARRLGKDAGSVTVEEVDELLNEGWKELVSNEFSRDADPVMVQLILLRNRKTVSYTHLTLPTN